MAKKAKGCRPITAHVVRTVADRLISSNDKTWFMAFEETEGFDPEVISYLHLSHSYFPIGIGTAVAKSRRSHKIRIAYFSLITHKCELLEKPDYDRMPNECGDLYDDEGVIFVKGYLKDLCKSLPTWQQFQERYGSPDPTPQE